MRSRTRARAAWTSSRVTIRREIPPARPPGKSPNRRPQQSPAPARRRRASCAGSVLDETAGQLDAVPHAELVEDRLQVALHGLRSDPESLRDLAGSEPVGDEERHLALALRETVRRRDRLHRLRTELHRLRQRLAPEVELGAPLADRRDLDAQPLAEPLHHERAADAGRTGLGALREPLELGRHRCAVGRVGEEGRLRPCGRRLPEALGRGCWRASWLHPPSKNALASDPYYSPSGEWSAAGGEHPSVCVADVAALQSVRPDAASWAGTVRPGGTDRTTQARKSAGCVG